MRPRFRVLGFAISLGRRTLSPNGSNGLQELESRIALIISEGLRLRGFVGARGLALELAREIAAALPSLLNRHHGESVI